MKELLTRVPHSVFFFWPGEFWRGKSLDYKWSEKGQLSNRGIALVHSNVVSSTLLDWHLVTKQQLVGGLVFGIAG